LAAIPLISQEKTRKHPINWRDGTFRTLYFAASGRRFVMAYSFHKKNSEDT